MSEPRVLLLTDIVDSTGITERLGESAASALWRTHDRAARDLMRVWHAREIDKSDGFLLMFGSVADAARFALAYQRAIAALDEPLQARTAIHAGHVIERASDAGDITHGAKAVEIDGLAKSVAARLLSLAPPGRTLLSAEAASALQQHGLQVHRHGHWRLQGVENPFELFELAEGGSAPAAQAIGPPPDTGKAYRVTRSDGGLWLPSRDLRHSLPAERDGFVGRVAELGALHRRLAQSRLVSVTGTAGAGKTRLVKRYGWSWLGDYGGGVWFCDLSQARTLDGIVHAVAQGLDLPPNRDDPVAHIGTAIASRGECLVIVDNFEQVLTHADATIGRWVEAAPRARFVVTTRAVLGIAGEQTLPLAPLPTADGVRLFQERAAASAREATPGESESSALAPLVELLDGLPLAIELAAARTRVMSARMLLDGMSQRFRLLGAARDHDRDAGRLRAVRGHAQQRRSGGRFEFR